MILQVTFQDFPFQLLPLYGNPKSFLSLSGYTLILPKRGRLKQFPIFTQITSF